MCVARYRHNTISAGITAGVIFLAEDLSEEAHTVRPWGLAGFRVGIVVSWATSHASVRKTNRRVYAPAITGNTV